MTHRFPNSSQSGQERSRLIHLTAIHYVFLINSNMSVLIKLDLIFAQISMNDLFQSASLDAVGPTGYNLCLISSRKVWRAELVRRDWLQVSGELSYLLT